MMASVSGLELLYHTISNDIVSKEDAFVCLLHWSMLINGYKCIGKTNEVPQNVNDTHSSEMLPQGWNENQDVYTLQFLHDDPERRQGVILLTVVRIEDNLLINAYNSENERTTCMTVSVSDYVDNDFHNFNNLFRNTIDFITAFQAEILKGLYAEKRQDSDTRQNSQQVPIPDVDPLRVPTYLPQPAASGWVDYQDPLVGVGRSDLDPLGRLGTGMLVDPRQRFQGIRPFNPSAGIPGQLPRGAVPPGARFDPFAPPDADQPNPRPRGGPNPDHLQPPGFDDMYT